MEKIYKCSYSGCSKEYNKKKKLEEHANTHMNIRPYVCQYCEKAYFKKSHLNDHVAKHFNPIFNCHNCTSNFHTKSDLNRHGKSCGVTYSCKICKKTYQRKKNYENHVEKHQRKIKSKKTHICEYCGFLFYKKSNLTVHISTVHKDIKKYVCVCGKEYKHNKSLNSHLNKCEFNKNSNIP